MSREEFLSTLREALTGEVPEAVIADNLNYYRNYLTQEMEKGRTVDEIVEEIGGPRIVAQTIIDTCEAGGESGGYTEASDGSYGGSYGDGSPYEDGGQQDGAGRSPHIHYYDLNKWYWKILIPVILIVVFCFLFYALGGIFYLLIRFAGPLLLIWLVFRMFRGPRD